MFSKHLETQPFTKPETLALVKRIQKLEVKHGPENFRARLKVLDRAYNVLVARGFKCDLPASTEIVGAQPLKKVA